MRTSMACLFALFMGTTSPPVLERSKSSPRSMDSRDLLLAALGKATLDCVGTLGPSLYSTTTGRLERTFDECTTGSRESLAHLDEVLGVQDSAPGREDALAEHYVARWNAFVNSFPRRLIRTCPTWTLENVIDAPTDESVARVTSLGRPGKEGYRYSVSSSQCGRNPRCAAALASRCAGGFGPGFLVESDGASGRIEIDPAWWLTHTEYPPEDECNPFAKYAHGFCMAIGSDPHKLYGTIERAGDRCCRWDEVHQQINPFGVFVPIDCDGQGWFCMSYCQLPP